MDDTLGSTWGYTDGMTYRSAESILWELIEIASMGGNLMLNISPMGDGSIPDTQQKILTTLGAWLKDHGEGIYDSRPWTGSSQSRYGEGPDVPWECPPDWKGGSTANQADSIKGRPRVRLTEADFRFTTNKGSMFAFGYKYPRGEASIRSLPAGAARVERVTLLGATPMPLQFRQTPTALVVEMPSMQPSNMPYGLKIEGVEPLG